MTGLKNEKNSCHILLHCNCIHTGDVVGLKHEKSFSQMCSEALGTHVYGLLPWASKPQKKPPTVPFVYTFDWLEFGIEKLLDSMFFENMTLQILLSPKWFSILYNIHYTVHTLYNIFYIYLFKTCSVRFSSKCSSK